MIRNYYYWSKSARNPKLDYIVYVCYAWINENIIIRKSVDQFVKKHTFLSYRQRFYSWSLLHTSCQVSRVIWRIAHVMLHINTAFIPSVKWNNLASCVGCCIASGLIFKQRSLPGRPWLVSIKIQASSPSKMNHSIHWYRNIV